MKIHILKNILTKTRFSNLKMLLLKNKEILIILAMFIVVYSINLEKFPRFSTDEAFFSNPAYSLVTAGKLGTTMMYGFTSLPNIENYTYWQPPVYLLLLAFSFKLFGMGITQARVVGVFLGLFVVFFTFLLGKELYNKKIGILAALVLVSNPLFFIFSRQIRMEIAVTCFTLIALYSILMALKRFKMSYYFYSGFFAALALLSHPNGLMGVISIVLIYIFSKLDFKKFKCYIHVKEIFYFIFGSILPSIPYLWYISLDFQSFQTQFMWNIGRSPSNPLSNIFSEYARYLVLFEKFNTILGPYLIIIFLIIIISLTILGICSLLKNRTFSDKFLGTILLIHLLILAVMVSVKNVFYFGILIPYWSILVVVIFKNISLPLKSTQGLKFYFKKHRFDFIIVLLLSGLILINTIGLINIFETSKDNDYYEIENEALKYIPEGSVVVGEAGFYMALQKHYVYYEHYYTNPQDYRRLNIQYILYDHHWKNYNTNDKTEVFIREFIDENCTQIGTIPKNKNIGYLSPIEVYKVTEPKIKVKDL